jgi:hypothetical protein
MEADMAFKQAMAKALLGVAVAGLSMVASAVPARAECLSFCFSDVGENSNSCEIVKYSTCGTNFHTLYQFNAADTQITAATCLNGGSGTQVINICPSSKTAKFSAVSSDVSDLFIEGTSNQCGVGLKIQGACIGLPNVATGCKTEEAEFGFISFPTSIGSVAFEDDGQGSGTLNQTAGQFNFQGNVLPEPSTYLSLFGGLGLLGISFRKKKAA